MTVGAKVGNGFFRTPTMRNVAKGEGKAYFHNGYFKRLEDVVHFYNTRDLKKPCAIPGKPDPTAAEAIANDCWPSPEFDKPEELLITAGKATGGIPVGNLGLSPAEERAIVKYLKTLSDTTTASAP